VADASTWSALWVRIYLGLQPQPPLPAVDFASDRLLVAAMGWRPTGGYSINIDSVVRSQGGTVVYVTMTAPGPSCGTTQTVTSPVHVVRLPWPPEPITFQNRNIVTVCQ